MIHRPIVGWVQTELSPLELASGIVAGEATDVVPLPEARGSVREALEEVLGEALASPPCVIAFSGGRDSSVLLAVAVDVARRLGLEEPVAYTMRFDAASAQESDWQERVIGHLGIQNWQVEHFGDELDILGPFAREAIARHGLRWPPNAYNLMPAMRVATQGTLVTGIDGDGLFENWQYRPLAGLVRSPRRPRRADLVLLGAAGGGRPVRKVVIGRRVDAELAWLDWLTPEAKAQVLEEATADQVSEPARWAKRVEWFNRRRYLAMVVESLSLLARDAGAQLVHAWAAGPVLAAAASQFAPYGVADRTHAFRIIAGDLLPEEVLVRKTKAEFTDAFWRPSSRALAGAWEGTGLDERIVSPDALIARWRSPVPPFASALLLQSLSVAAGA